MLLLENVKIYDQNDKVIFEEKLNNKDVLVENLKKELYIKDLELKLKIQG